VLEQAAPQETEEPVAAPATEIKKKKRRRKRGRSTR